MRSGDTQKAYDLLMSHLNVAQQYTYETWGFFYLRGSDRALYAIWDGDWILKIEAGVPVGDLIGAHIRTEWLYGLRTSLPISDRILMQKLMLETQARRVRHMACSYPLYSHNRVIPQVLLDGSYYRHVIESMRWNSQGDWEKWTTILKAQNELFNPPRKPRVVQSRPWWQFWKQPSVYLGDYEGRL